MSAAILLAGFIVTAAGHGYAGYSAYSAYQKSASAGATATPIEEKAQLSSPGSSRIVVRYRILASGFPQVASG
jgi:hypothetical protein